MTGATLTASIVALLMTTSDSPAVRLEPCPQTPNCVSTLAERDHQRMEPIPYSGGLETARARLLSVLSEQPRVEISAASEDEIRAVFTTRLMRFKDDVSLVFDTERQLIHFRSASRLGRSDFGVNRERMERIARLFAASEAGGETS